MDFADAYAIRVFPGAPTDPQVWADAVFRDPPRWVVGLMLLREAAVGLVGIARGGRSWFDPVQRADEEVLLGTDERHLDFRASVQQGAAASGAEPPLCGCTTGAAAGTSPWSAGCTRWSCAGC